jgi:hypothetical protein
MCNAGITLKNLSKFKFTGTNTKCRKCIYKGAITDENAKIMHHTIRNIKAIQWAVNLPKIAQNSATEHSQNAATYVKNILQKLVISIILYFQKSKLDRFLNFFPIRKCQTKLVAFPIIYEILSSRFIFSISFEKSDPGY